MTAVHDCPSPAQDACINLQQVTLRRKILPGRVHRVQQASKRSPCRNNRGAVRCSSAGAKQRDIRLIATDVDGTLLVRPLGAS